MREPGLRRQTIARGFGRKGEPRRVLGDVELGRRPRSRGSDRGNGIAVSPPASASARWRGCSHRLRRRCRVRRRRRSPTPTAPRPVRSPSRRSRSAPALASAWLPPTRSRPLRPRRSARASSSVRRCRKATARPHARAQRRSRGRGRRGRRARRRRGAARLDPLRNRPQPRPRPPRQSERAASDREPRLPRLDRPPAHRRARRERLRPHPHRHLDRRDAAPDPGPSRLQPLPLGARRRRAQPRRPGLYPRAHHADRHRRPQFLRPLRHHPRASPRGDRGNRDRPPALCRARAGPGPRPPADAMDRRRRAAMVRGVGRRPLDRRADPAGARADDLGLRLPHPSDPRLSPVPPRARRRRPPRHADRRDHRRPGRPRRLGRRLRQYRRAPPCRRAFDALRPYEPDRGLRRPARPPGPGDRLCRLDRPLDRPPSPLRNVPQRPAGRPALGPLRQPFAVLEGSELAGFRSRLRTFLALPVGSPASPGAAAVRNAP